MAVNMLDQGQESRAQCPGRKSRKVRVSRKVALPSLALEQWGVGWPAAVGVGSLDELF